jgi:hypothetical protein
MVPLIIISGIQVEHCSKFLIKGPLANDIFGPLDVLKMDK